MTPWLDALGSRLLRSLRKMTAKVTRGFAEGLCPRDAGLRSVRKDGGQVRAIRRIVGIFLHEHTKNLDGALIETALGVDPAERVHKRRIVGRCSNGAFGQAESAVQIGSTLGQVEGKIVHRGWIIGIAGQLFFERRDGVLDCTGIALQDADGAENFRVVGREFAGLEITLERLFGTALHLIHGAEGFVSLHGLGIGRANPLILLTRQIQLAFLDRG